MSERVRLVLGVAVIAIGLFWNQIVVAVQNIDLDLNRPIISVPEPSEEILGKVSRLAGLVTDKNDRDSLGVFNYIFSKRVKSYDADSQQINDIYVGAAKKMYGETLRGKYDGYGEGIANLMKDTLGTENHSVPQEEKEELSTNFF